MDHDAFIPATATLAAEYVPTLFWDFSSFFKLVAEALAFRRIWKASLLDDFTLAFVTLALVGADPFLLLRFCCTMGDNEMIL